MKTSVHSYPFLAAIILFCVGVSSCTSPREYQRQLSEKEEQIRRLNEERAELRRQVQGLRSSLDSAHGELANASARMSEPAPEIDTAKDAKSFPELDELGVSYGVRDGNMVLSIPSSITFASGQATLSSDGQKALKQVASTLKSQYPGADYSIEGHTDTDPIQKSKFASNRDLSVQRAMAVLTYLVEECGIPDAQCIVAGHGQYEPVAKNDSKDAKAKNRRVEIVVHKK